MEIYRERRARLMAQMGEEAILVLPSQTIKVRNGDVEYPFRQDSDFYYLTGFNEPNALLVLIPGRVAGEAILFNEAKDEVMERWIGPRVGQQQAVAAFGMDESYSIVEVNKHLPVLLENKETIYCTIAENSMFDHQLQRWLKAVRQKVRSGVKAPGTLKSVRPLTSEMRLIKSQHEIELMQKAVDISVDAHLQAMKICPKARVEYELEAELQRIFVSQGAREPAYGSIVGGGENSCILHYTANNQPLNDGEVVLIDAGAEYHHYAADITRTFPVNGKYSEPQRLIYNLVLQAQLAVIDIIKPGVAWNKLQEKAVTVITKGLVELGLLKGDIKTLIENKQYANFYMHNIGHFLGMDVHDVGSYKINGKWRELQQGMVLTVEPGIYISPGQKKVAKKWWNIGVRIEDDVLVTKNGAKVLSEKLPKTIEEIESWMANG